LLRISGQMAFEFNRFPQPAPHIQTDRPDFHRLELLEKRWICTGPNGAE
jgi:hypothetical protein